MKDDDIATLSLPEEMKASKTVVKRKVGKSSGTGKWGNENWEKQVMVTTFDKKPVHKATLGPARADAGCCIFKMTGKNPEKMEWRNLSASHKKAFREVINTFSGSEEFSAIPEDEAEGFSFAYCDEEVELSAVCFTQQGKVMLFYKEVVV